MHSPIYYNQFATPIGLVSIAVTGDGAVCGVVVGRHRQLHGMRLLAEEEDPLFVYDPDITQPVEKNLQRYLAGDPIDLSLLRQAAAGTAFQFRVWKALQRIPYGATLSYSALAAKMKIPQATRAVAQACGANPLAILIPCHRVVRSDGSLGGYRWGLKAKERLLKLEEDHRLRKAAA